MGLYVARNDKASEAHLNLRARHILSKVDGFLLIPFAHHLHPAEHETIELLDRSLSLLLLIVNACVAARVLRFDCQYDEEPGKKKVIAPR
jgi:hypothetical protein